MKQETEQKDDFEVTRDMLDVIDAHLVRLIRQRMYYSGVIFSSTALLLTAGAFGEKSKEVIKSKEEMLGALSDETYLSSRLQDLLSTIEFYQQKRKDDGESELRKQRTDTGSEEKHL